MNWETLLCLGDSVTLGTRTYLGFPEITGELLRNHTSKYWNVFNFSKADYTVADLNRLISENFNELKQLTPDLATILIGINDAKKKTSDADFEIIYRQVLLKTKLISKK
jgi:lysophospholipase L1-like esterase